MALPSPKSEPLVPLRRVLPVVGSNVSVAAGRVVRGRLRFRVRTGWRIYVPHEDYLSLCEAAWDTSVRRMTRREQAAIDVPPEEPRADSVKPIHDGRPLDRHRRNPLLRWIHAVHRWWSRR